MRSPSRFLAKALSPIPALSSLTQHLVFLVTLAGLFVGGLANPLFWLLLFALVVVLLWRAGVQLQKDLDELSDSHLSVTGEWTGYTEQPLYLLTVRLDQGEGDLFSAECIEIDNETVSFVLDWGEQADLEMFIPTGQARRISLAMGYAHRDKDTGELEQSVIYHGQGRRAHTFMTGQTSEFSNYAKEIDAAITMATIRLSGRQARSTFDVLTVALGFDDLKATIRVTDHHRVVGGAVKPLAART